MEKSTAITALLPDATLSEKLDALGIAGGKMLDIRTLDTIARTYDIEIYLFFEKALTDINTIEEVVEKYKLVPEYERPYIRVESFLKFTRENDPMFMRTMEEFPPTIKIVKIGQTRSAKDGCSVPYVTGMMPYVDELDFDFDPGK